MATDVTTQLLVAGRLLDQLAPPLTVAELTDQLDRRRGDSSFDLHTLNVEREGPMKPDTQRRRAFVGAAAVAAAAVLMGALALLVGRSPGQQTTDVATASSSTTPSSTGNPLPELDMPPGAVPADAALRFATSLGDGDLWVYDSASTAQVCFLHRTNSADGFGCIDQDTYRSGLGWSLEGTPGSWLLWGITPSSNPVTVAVGNTTTTSDTNGVWFIVPPADATSFTITTATDVTTFEIATSPVGTTLVVGDALASAAFCDLAADAVDGQIVFNDPNQTGPLVNDPSLSDWDRRRVAGVLDDAARQAATGVIDNAQLVDLVNELCGTNFTPVTMMA